MRGDFHIHTTYSDGSYTVDEILKMAKDLDVISITDHDVLSGVLEAKKIEDKLDIKIIVGVELSTKYKNESVHILGFFNNLTEITKFEGYLKKQRKKRLERAFKINDKLRELYNIDLNMDFVERHPSITRGTIANEIISQGFPYNRKHIFDKMLGDDSPAYLPSTKMSTQYGIKLIQECHGLAVLAHPVLLKKVKVEEIIEMGIDGIEAIYPANTNADTSRLMRLAKANKIFITGGSDFHSKDDNKHGNIGDIYLEGNHLDIFLKKLMEVN